MRRGRASLLRDARDPRVDVALRRHLLTETFVELRREYPEVTCELFTGNADVVEERLERGLLDFALIIEPVNVEKYEWLRVLSAIAPAWSWRRTASGRPSTP